VPTGSRTCLGIQQQSEGARLYSTPNKGMRVLASLRLGLSSRSRASRDFQVYRCNQPRLQLLSLNSYLSGAHKVRGCVVGRKALFSTLTTEVLNSPRRRPKTAFILASLVAGGIISTWVFTSYGDLVECKENHGRLLIQDPHAQDLKQRAEALFMDSVRMSRTIVSFCRVALIYKWAKFISHGKSAEERLKIREAVHASGAEHILALCRQNGGIFVKIGQHAASLKGALPSQYIEQLGTLQDRASARPVSEIWKTLEEELGNDALANALANIDPDPVGCASLAQVHRATLKDGRVVALKVQHRDLHRVLRSDLHLVKYLNTVATWLFSNEGFSLDWAVREFEENLSRELDFLEEAQNCERSAKNFRGDARLSQTVRVPSVQWELTTPRLICMDYIKGIPISRVQELKAMGVDCNEVASIVLDAFAAMIFEYGFVHCDPHPGNLLVCPGKGNIPTSVVLLDHGLYRDLGEDFRQQNCRLWKAMILQDQVSLQATCQAMGMPSLWDLMPFVFVNRTVDTQAHLGEQARLTAAELRDIKARLGISKLGLADIGSLADKLPDDMVLVLKTMHLIKDLNDKLGGSNRNRFMVYAKSAVRGDNEASWLPFGLRWILFLSRFYLHENLIHAHFKISPPHAVPVQQSLSAVLSESFEEVGVEDEGKNIDFSGGPDVDI